MNEILTQPPALPRPALPPGIEKHRVSFAGSGASYFRLWLANVLLVIVTLGIYTPWARRRRIQYFFRNTEAGRDPFDFTASTGSMAKGFFLVVLIYALIEIMSAQGLKTAASLIMLLIAAAVPWLWRSALRFRMASTSWRGLPFEFQATTREAYVAAWPLLGVAALAAVVALLVPDLAPGKRTVNNTGLSVGVLAMIAFSALALLGVVLIRLRFNFLQLQMTRTALGGLRSNFKAGFSDFLKVGLLCLGIGLAAYLLLAGLLAGFGAGLVTKTMFGQGLSKNAAVLALVLLVALLIPLLLVPASITLAAWQAMVFRTVWSQAGLAQLARSKCRLSTRAFVLLRCKNVFLTLLTLGLYRPFAAVAEYRMLVESVRIYTRGDLDELADRLARNRPDALGDAAADLAGFDLAV